MGNFLEIYDSEIAKTHQMKIKLKIEEEKLMKLQKNKQRMIGNQYENFKQKLLSSEQTYQLSTKSFTPLQSQDKGGNRTSSTPLEVSQMPQDDHPQFHEALRTVKSGIGFKQ